MVHLFCCYRSSVQSARLSLAPSIGRGSSVPAGSGWSPPSRYTGQRLMRLELSLKESLLLNDLQYYFCALNFVRLFLGASASKLNLWRWGWLTSVWEILSMRSTKFLEGSEAVR